MRGQGHVSQEAHARAVAVAEYLEAVRCGKVRSLAVRSGAEDEETAGAEEAGHGEGGVASHRQEFVLEQPQTRLVVKLHRLGKTSVKTLKNNRDYLGPRASPV